MSPGFKIEIDAPEPRDRIGGSGIEIVPTINKPLDEKARIGVAQEQQNQIGCAISRPDPAKNSETTATRETTPPAPQPESQSLTPIQPVNTNETVETAREVLEQKGAREASRLLHNAAKVRKLQRENQ